MVTLPVPKLGAAICLNRPIGWDWTVESGGLPVWRLRAGDDQSKLQLATPRPNHSCRHITAGRINNFSKHPVRYWLWGKIGVLNGRHMNLAWTTLATLVLTDFYIMRWSPPAPFLI